MKINRIKYEHVKKFYVFFFVKLLSDHLLLLNVTNYFYKQAKLKVIIYLQCNYIYPMISFLL